MNLLILLVIIAAITLTLGILLLAYTFDQRPGRVGGRPILSSVVDRFTVAPEIVPVGEPTEFRLQSLANNPASTGSQLRPVSGRRIQFVVGPSPVVILSVNGTPVNGESAAGFTDRDGIITVTLLARGIPETGPVGALVAQASALGSKKLELDFEVE